MDSSGGAVFLQKRVLDYVRLLPPWRLSALLCSAKERVLCDVPSRTVLTTHKQHTGRTESAEGELKELQNKKCFLHDKETDMKTKASGMPAERLLAMVDESK